MDDTFVRVTALCLTVLFGLLTVSIIRHAKSAIAVVAVVIATALTIISGSVVFHPELVTKHSERRVELKYWPQKKATIGMTEEAPPSTKQTSSKLEQLRSMPDRSIVGTKGGQAWIVIHNPGFPDQFDVFKGVGVPPTPMDLTELDAITENVFTQEQFLSYAIKAVRFANQ